MSFFYVILGFYVVYLASRIIPLFRQRFRTEHTRQLVITRPKTVARLGDNRQLVERIVERQNQGPGIYWEAQLREPYTYFQQGELKQRVTIAPGKMKLNRTQARALEKFLQGNLSLIAYLEPREEGEVFLTPGPALFSWRSLATGLALVFFPLLLAYFLPLPVLTAFLAVLSASMLEAWAGQQYTTEIQAFLRPAPPLGGEGERNKTPEETPELRPVGKDAVTVQLPERTTPKR